MSDYKIDTFSNTNRYYTFTIDDKVIVRDTYENTDIFIFSSKSRFSWVYKDGNDYLKYRSKGFFSKTRYFDCTLKKIVKQV